MRLLVDTCVAVQVVAALRAAGHDVVYVGEREIDPGDEAIMEEAFRETRILITRDKDFGALAVQAAKQHFGILLLRRMPLREQASACRSVLAKHEDDLRQGALLTVQPGRVRIRRANEP